MTLLSERGPMTAALIARLALASDRGYQALVGEQPKK
jgi:hypothetical protein